MVPVAAENNEVVLENHACVTVSSGRSLTLDMEDLSLALVSAQHRRLSIIEPHTACHSTRLSLLHLLVVLVEVGGVMVLDQEGVHHVVGRW